MSDNTRYVPPPMGPGGARTLGDVRSRIGGAVQQRPGAPNSSREMDEKALDPATGQWVGREATQAELQQLIEQQQRLAEPPTAGSKPNLGGPTPNLRPPSSQNFGPNVTQEVKELPKDRLRQRLPSDEIPEDGETGQPPIPREELLSRLAGKRVTNELTDGPQKPPEIDREARAAALRAKALDNARGGAQRQRADDEANIGEDESGVYTGKPRFVLKEITREPGYTRVPLLSGFVFYPWKDLQVRRVNLPTAKAISAAQTARDLTAFIDAVGSTLGPDVDIRDMVMPDFRHLLYWHRFNSYSSVPFNVTWTSKYGNVNQYRIDQTKLQYKPPTITEEEYADWQKRGFAVPTVRDFEVFERENLNEEEAWLFERAQWFAGIPNENGVVDIQNKIDHMAELTSDSIDVLGELEQFREATYFEVVEKIEVLDAKFDAAKWAETLDVQADTVYEEAQALRGIDAVQYALRVQESKDLRAEADEIRTTLEKGGEVKPDVETRNLQIGLLNFFPDL